MDRDGMSGGADDGLGDGAGEQMSDEPCAKSCDMLVAVERVWL
jgi:hypothetical protein